MITQVAMPQRFASMNMNFSSEIADAGRTVATEITKTNATATMQPESMMNFRIRREITHAIVNLNVQRDHGYDYEADLSPACMQMKMRV